MLQMSAFSNEVVAPAATPKILSNCKGAWTKGSA